MLVALPPVSSGKKIKSYTEDECVICGWGISIFQKQYPLQKLHDSWNAIADKAQEWKVLEAKYNELHEKIQVGTVPKKIHKVCRLEIVGQKLSRVQKSSKKSFIEENVLEAVANLSPRQMNHIHEEVV